MCALVTECLRHRNVEDMGLNLKVHLFIGLHWYPDNFCLEQLDGHKEPEMC